MSIENVVTAFWSTASRSAAPVSSTGERESLGEHLSACRRSQGRLFVVQRGAQHVVDVLSARRVTAIVVVGLICGGGSLAFL